MAVELKLAKFDNTPWGFRLVGGADFDTPLTVIKVSEGSLAEEAGMRLGDTVVRVNDTALASLSHAQAHDLIREAGNNFSLAVFRGKVGDPIPQPKPLAAVSQITAKSPAQQALGDDADIKLPEPGESPILEYALSPGEQIIQKVEMSKLEALSVREESSSITTVMQEGSSQMEVTQHTEMSSKLEKAALSSMTEIRTASPSKAVQLQYTVDMNADPNIEAKPKAQPGETVISDHWSSFLQKPKNAIPKSKKEDDVERAKEPPYRVVITKIKRKLSRDLNEYKEKGLLAKASEINTEDTQNINVSQPIKLESSANEDIENVPDLPFETEVEPPVVAEPVAIETKPEEPVQVLEPENEEEEEPRELTEEEKEQRIQESQKRQELLTDISSTATSMLTQFLDSSKMISESDLSMEDQLTLVQRQLQALSQLPVAIQATLSAVTTQLSKIVKPSEGAEINGKKVEEQVKSKPSGEKPIPSIVAPSIEAPAGLEHPVSTQSGEDAKDKEKVTPIIKEPTDSIPIITEEKSNEVSQADSIAPTPVPTPTPEPELTPEEQEKVDKKLKAERLSQKQEEAQIFEDQLNKKRNIKPHFPSAPLNRPIVLPGGKKWREPDDVIPHKINARKYTDELIAETISSQSEIITGTTLGINFLKYQPKPPKNLDHLKESEVYKMVHALDLPTRGIAGRPSLCVAEEDVYSLQKQIEEESNVVQVQLPTQKPPQLEP